ncbi:MAG: hypothetical protein K2Z81_28030 [Cyanobacteria bacterium]|nr:hypothetical protein [Cyanobacteriota bacterium]
MPNIVKLRDLPGIAELEAALHIPGRQLLKQFDDLDERIDGASRRYFGIGEPDTRFRYSEADLLPSFYGTRDGVRLLNDDARRREESWEANFAFLESGHEETDKFWKAAGWDINHQAKPLLIMEYFGRQMVCVIKQLLPEAVFSATGDHAPISEKALRHRLEEEARQFSARKRGRISTERH